MKRKILVFSIALEGFEQKFADCIKTQIEYCNCFQYEYVLLKQAPYHLSRDEAGWLKVPMIKAGLAARYEWVAFLDADCEIRPHTPSFPEYLSALSTDKTVFLAPGFSGRINSGVILVKNSPEAVEFFDTILSNVDFEIPAPEDRVGWGENGHFIYYGKNHPTVFLLEHTMWNNNSHLNDQSYIQHYVTGPMREWYLNHHPQPNKVINDGLISKYYDKILQKLRKPHQIKDEPVILSKSLNKLLLYYTKMHPEFRNNAAQIEG